MQASQMTISQMGQAGAVPKRKTKISDERREYLRQYYLKNRDRLRAYQREYNATHKRKSSPNRIRTSFAEDRETIRSTFTPSDIMRSTPEKSLRILELILAGKRELTM